MYLSILFYLYLIVCFSLLYYFGIIIIIYKIIKSQKYKIIRKLIISYIHMKADVLFIREIEKIDGRK